jgi:hypothetical protein
MVDNDGINILNKLVNHKIFRDKFPEINSVDVREFGNGVDVVYFFDSRVNYKDRGPIRYKADNMVRDLARMSGVGSVNFHFYPQYNS